MARNTARVLLRALVGLVLLSSIARAEEKSVRVVYLVSQDRAERSDFKAAIDDAIRDVQRWYSRQLGGRAFKLHQPAVEVARSSQPAAWFTSNPNGEHMDDWGFNNALSEAGRLMGARVDDPRYVWVIYSDGPGNKGRASRSFAYLPEDDLLGLVGQHPTQRDPKRWIGGLGHEIGHAFGLDHPRNTAKHYGAIMWAGFYKDYPAPTYLTPEDKQILRASPLFYPEIKRAGAAAHSSRNRAHAHKGASTRSTRIERKRSLTADRPALGSAAAAALGSAVAAAGWARARAPQRPDQHRPKPKRRQSSHAIISLLPSFQIMPSVKHATKLPNKRHKKRVRCYFWGLTI